MARRKRGGAEEVQRLAAGEIADHHARQQFDHGRDGGALVPAEGQHGTGERGFRVGGRFAIGVHGPAFGQLPALAAVQLYLAARGNAGGEVEHIGRAVFTARPAEGEGVGAEQGILPSSRCHRGIARAHGDRRHTQFGEPLHLRPQGGEMGAIVDDERGDAEAFRARGKNGRAKLERRAGIAAAGVHTHHRRTVVLQYRP